MRRFIPSLAALECFEAAARHLSFTHAALTLGITQSGVSRQIAALEHFLGLKLFERIGSRLVLTEVGEAYLRDTHRLLSELETSAIDAVRGQSLSDAFTIEAPAGFALHWLIPRLPRLRDTMPDVLIEICMKDNSLPPHESHADLMIRRGAGTWRGVRAEPLASENLTVVASKELADLQKSLGTLDFERLPSLQNATRPDLWLTWLRSADIPYKGAIKGPRFDNSAALITAARHGLGLALVPRTYVISDLEDELLHEPFKGKSLSIESFWALSSAHLPRHPQSSRVMSWLKREIPLTSKDQHGTGETGDVDTPLFENASISTDIAHP
ncbi:LysR substrate-binding domain-containing protein [Celeribacter persicus]|uniref:DNA-binding transcriptional LysR family regulator n=1 Tax=Celeribacter persicus TaxID=1651082 RepID=A0A2T5H5F9_9RHOB|nr:LysR substrate-binding domain-containing protein [Celeribacter persicus]PTQ66816.1 DNA-binding transcriptional LysR family regulator [Celeribacter persicus]